MHKKLASELTNLAHKILRMSDKDDVVALKKQAYEIYEKLTVLAYVEEYIATTPQATETKEELIGIIENAENVKQLAIEKNDAPVFSETVQEDVVKPKTFEYLKQDVIEDDIKFDETAFIEEQKATTTTLEDELKDTVSIDITADLFAKAEPKKSLNDHLQQSIQIGLNDRIAFVKHLFNGNQADYNRVISQLNTLDNEQEAKKFINKNVKLDYDWSDKQEYETRLLEIIERRFA